MFNTHSLFAGFLLQGMDTDSSVVSAQVSNHGREGSSLERGNRFLSKFLYYSRRFLIFQQDNARPHVARQTLDFLHAAGITLLDWPANSPDLNPIEHLWDELARRVNEREVVPTTCLLYTSDAADE